jgi:ABC-type Zn2+ transport system substrate-binding protein/surface adhesin
VYVFIARKFSPKHILGVDVDEDLIKRAQQQLERDQRRKGKYEERKANRIKFGDDGKPEEQSSKEEALKKKEEEKEKDETNEENGEKEQQMDVEKSEAKRAYPHNIAFQTENFVEDKGQHEGKYDVILWYDAAAHGIYAHRQIVRVLSVSDSCLTLAVCRATV